MYLPQFVYSFLIENLREGFRLNNWIFILYLSIPICTIMWGVGMWSTWKDSKLRLMNTEVNRIWNSYIIDTLPYDIEFGVGMFDDIMKSCWKNNWKPLEFIKLFNKKFSR